MGKNKQIKPNTIFVDCFNTIIFRTISKNEVFKNWARELSNEFYIPWKKIYKKYKSTNFGLCFKKLFLAFTLQEKFEIVLQKLHAKLAKKYNLLNCDEFINTAMDIYAQKELDCFSVNENMISFLKEEKQAGKKIYLVSDFYCDSSVIKKWFTSLEIEQIFDDIFSSSDFEKEKATTKLYKKLISLLSLEPKSVIMYGDNIWSDVMMAKACRLNAKRIKTKCKGLKNEK